MTHLLLMLTLTSIIQSHKVLDRSGRNDLLVSAQSEIYKVKDTCLCLTIYFLSSVNVRLLFETAFLMVLKHILIYLVLLWGELQLQRKAPLPLNLFHSHSARPSPDLIQFQVSGKVILIIYTLH